MPLFFLWRRFSALRNPTTAALMFTSGMLFFWSLFDGLVSFISPVLFVQNGLSKSSMGFVIGSSSVAGALFDFILSKYLRNTHYRRMYLLMLLFSFFMPLLLWQSKAIWIYLIAMVVWGLYYDFLSFGNFDFVSRTSAPTERSNRFGAILTFKSLGYVVAPVLAGYLIVSHVSPVSFLLMMVSLILAAGFYGFLVARGARADIQPLAEHHKKLHVLKELWIWEKIGVRLLPVLLLTLFLSIIDAYFWTIGPLIAQQSQDTGGFGGFFLFAYSLPSLCIGLFVGPIVRKLHKKRAAFLSLLLGSFLLVTLFLAASLWISTLIVFLSSGFISLAWPAINGAYADYIAEAPSYQREIQALEDFAVNIGYIVGPITAGLLADVVGNAAAISTLGAVGMIVAVVLFIVTPKSIVVSRL